jgi:DNA excision repair protein ERCC-1
MYALPARNTGLAAVTCVQKEVPIAIAVRRNTTGTTFLLGRNERGTLQNNLGLSDSKIFSVESKMHRLVARAFDMIDPPRQWTKQQPAAILIKIWEIKEMNPIANPYAKKHPQPQKRLRLDSQQIQQQQQPNAAVTTTTTTNHIAKNNHNCVFAKPPPIPHQSLVPAAAPMQVLLQPQPPKAMTFSQAFDDTDEEPNNKSAVGNKNNNGPPSLLPSSLTNMHQPFDESVTVAVAESLSTKSNANHNNHKPTITDRDHHAFLLQQPHVLYVSTKQRGNAVLEYIRNVPISFSKMVPDYIFNTTSCALFLSIKYHNLYPRYIYSRIAELGKDFMLRILLVLVDCTDNAAVLLHLNKMAVQHDLTLILAWSPEEAARYLETYKALDGKDASSIQKTKDQTHFADQVHDFLTTCKGLNKTDAASILTQFGTMRSVMAATPDELALVTGIGPIKVKRLYDAFHKPFSAKLAKQRTSERETMAREEMLLQQEQEILDKEEEEKSCISHENRSAKQEEMNT